MTRVEGENTRVSHYLARLKRKTLSYSKSLECVLILIKQWLSNKGLKISDEKTRIVHMNDGFDFLGFNLRHYNGKLLIKPQKKKVLAFCKKIGHILF